MGIRGTKFDYTIVTNTLTDLVTFQGNLLLCNEANSCAFVSGACSVGQAPSFSPVRAPEDTGERDAIIRSDMPFVLDQSTLSRAFQVNIASCGNIGPIPDGYRPYREDPNAGPQPLGEDRKQEDEIIIEEEDPYYETF